MCAQIGKRIGFLGTRHSLLPNCLLFVLPDQRPCTVNSISDSVEIVYELPLLPNNTAVKHIYTNRKRCEVLTGYLSLGRQPGGDWENTWHWTKGVTIFFFKQEVVAASVSATFCRIPREGLCGKLIITVWINYRIIIVICFNNYAAIHNYYGRLLDFIFLLKIHMDTRMNFFETGSGLAVRKVGLPRPAPVCRIGRRRLLSSWKDKIVCLK
jgi:hypothetical protein